METNLEQGHNIGNNVLLQENSETLPQCTDMPLFADCTLLINVKHFNPDSYCNDNYYYSKFCCKSCTEAGLPLHEAFLKTMGEEFNENYQIKLAERSKKLESIYCKRIFSKSPDVFKFVRFVQLLEPSDLTEFCKVIDSRTFEKK